MSKRLAIMYVSNETLEALASPMVFPTFENIDLDWLKQALLLPDNATIVATSAHLRFCYNQLALRIECPDFIETPAGHQIPEVRVWYGKGKESVFLCWSGQAVASNQGAWSFNEVRASGFWPDQMPAPSPADVSPATADTEGDVSDSEKKSDASEPRHCGGPTVTKDEPSPIRFREFL